MGPELEECEGQKKAPCGFLML
uniref:Uncharacterized protein n=1 Tax=Anguilla anguilla TaxID=7936 RepID=A0A0E9QLT6_ANGAN